MATTLRQYIGGFSPSAREVIDKFRFEEQITRLDEAGLLYLVVSRFVDVDLHPEAVGNSEMGYIYEELIRRFSEQSNETAGEHFTPREVIGLMVNLLFAEDDALLRDEGVVKTLLDPACGTGGMLAVAAEHLTSMNPKAHLEVFGQELNDESFAICRSDMMLKGQSSTNIVSGNSFSADGFVGRTFDYLLANPPFGVEWKNVEAKVKDEAKMLGFAGRFGAGLPRINDGSLPSSRSGPRVGRCGRRSFWRPITPTMTRTTSRSPRRKPGYSDGFRDLPRPRTSFGSPRPRQLRHRQSGRRKPGGHSTHRASTPTGITGGGSEGSGSRRTVVCACPGGSDRRPVTVARVLN